MHPVVISYYTPGTAYETLASRLRRSVETLGLSHCIEPRTSRGGWVENCAQKAHFIRETRAKLGRPVLWVDADGVMLRPLHDLASSSADFAVVRREGWSFYGGQVYFGIGEAADLVLDLWCDYCTTHPHVWDQASLGYAWWDARLRRGIAEQWLPEEIFAKESRSFLKRWWQHRFGRQAILHKQESRRSKGLAHASEFPSDRIPQWWRDAVRADRPFALNEAQRAELGLSLPPPVAPAHRSADASLELTPA